MSVECEFCKKPFATANTMRRHAKRFHFRAMQDSWIPKSSKEPDLSADTTNILYSNTIMNCPLCSTTGKQNELIDHFEDSHSLRIVRECISFTDLYTFDEWKLTTEKVSTSHFIKMGSDRIGLDGSKLIDYCCSRNGILAQHKIPNGSSTTQNFCPALMSVEIKYDCSVVVNFIRTHFGHSVDLECLRLTKSQRESLTQKVSGKIPFDASLDQFPDDNLDNRVDRCSVISKKDLYNIETAYNLLWKSENDVDGVESIIDNIIPTGIIRYFKAQNSAPIDDILKYEDFFLVFFNDVQLDMLLKYGEKCICVVGCPPSNSHNYALTTVLVLDELNRGFPTCFLISSRNDFETMKHFFWTIAVHAGSNFTTDVLLTDATDYYYDGWRSVFPAPRRQFFFNSHVDKLWKTDVKRTINSSNHQQIVYKELRVLLEVGDKETFQLLIEHFTDKWLSDVNTSTFGEHFYKEYKPKCVFWANCYRSREDVDADNHVETIYKTLKTIYLHNSSKAKVNVAMYALMRFTRSKAFDILIFLRSEQLRKKIDNVKKFHGDALDDSFHFGFIENTLYNWDCVSLTDTEQYSIDQNQIPHCHCLLKCEDCGFCIHQFVCSCLDSSVEWNMCSHIHYLCFKVLKNVYTVSSLESSGTDDVMSSIQQVPQEIVTLNSNLETYRANGFRLLNQAINELRRTSSFDEMEAIIEPVKECFSALQAIRRGEKLSFHKAGGKVSRARKPNSKKGVHSTNKTKGSRLSPSLPIQRTPEEPSAVNVQIVPSDEHGQTGGNNFHYLTTLELDVIDAEGT